VTAADSLSATVQFTRPLDPFTTLDPATVTIRLLPDSIPVHVVSVLPKRVDDSLQTALRARADSLRQDSLRRVADSTKAGAAKPAPAQPQAGKTPSPAAPGQRTTAAADSALRKLLAQRPPLSDQVVIRVDSAFVRGAKYVVDMRGVRGVGGGESDAHGGLTIPPAPKRPAADTTKSRIRPDSSGAPSDSIAPKPAPKPPRSRQ
jgi:hypothetical protein